MEYNVYFSIIFFKIKSIFRPIDYGYHRKCVVVYLTFITVFALIIEIFTFAVVYNLTLLQHLIPFVISYFIITGTIAELYSSYLFVLMAIGTRIKMINDNLRLDFIEREDFKIKNNIYWILQGEM